MSGEQTRRDFVKMAAAAGTVATWSATSYAKIVGANDRVRVGVVGCGDRMKGALIPSFLQHNKEMNFEFAVISDLWNRRRDEGVAYIDKLCGCKVDTVPILIGDQGVGKSRGIAALCPTADCFTDDIGPA